MKKNMRKILSLVLAMVMILSLSVTAFASTTSAPTVTITVDAPNGEVVTPITLTGVAGDSLKKTLDDSNVNVSWNDEVSDYYNPSIKHSALISLNGYGTLAASASRSKDVELLRQKGYTASTLDWIEGRPGYAELDYNEETGEYHYLYAGYDWTYKNADGQIWTYMCCHNLADGEEVELTYSFQVTDWWTDEQILPIVSE